MEEAVSAPQCKRPSRWGAAQRHGSRLRPSRTPPEPGTCGPSREAHAARRARNVRQYALVGLLSDQLGQRGPCRGPATRGLV